MQSIRLIVILLCVVLFSSCEKELDLLPTDLISEANVFQSVADLEKGLYGVYGALPGENDMFVNAVVSDETKLSNENRGQGQFEFKWQYTAADGGLASATWDNYYYLIGLANKVLIASDNVKASSQADINLKNQIKGELLALRAFAHFQMLQCFSGRYQPGKLGIPYTSTSDIAAKPARASASSVIAAIENDLAAAVATPTIPDAPLAVPSAGLIRLSKASIAGIRARVALYKASGLPEGDAIEEWNNAKNFALEAITKSGKSLAVGTEYADLWTDDNESELIFKLRRTGSSVGRLWQDNNGNVFFEPSDKLKSLFNRTKDRRFPIFFKINSNPDEDTCLVNKFFESSRGPKIVDVKMMRVSEMYLIIAEANAELNDLAGAAQYYNDLRRNRINGYINENFLTKSEAIENIYNERARELCFEGFRYYDHIRRGLIIDRFESDVQSFNWKTLSATDHRMIFPIPQTSTIANPNMVQNPNY